MPTLTRQMPGRPPPAARCHASLAAAALAMAATLLVAGCDKDRCEEPAATQAAPSSDGQAGIRKAAETAVRASTANPDAVRFRGEQVWPQAIKGQFAVCGQANVFGPSSNTFVLFVAVVTHDAFNPDPARQFKVETRVGSTVSEATRAYIDTLGRCFEGGGPLNARRETVAPVPPLPDDMNAVLAPPPPRTAAAGSPPASSPPAGMMTQSVGTQSVGTQGAGAQGAGVQGAAPASGTVIVRQNANIRSGPHGEVVRVEQQGKELHVFGEAPGGWLQIGGSAPDGWIHSSMVQGR